MLRIVPRPPLSSNVTLPERLLPAAARGVATPRSNDRSRLSLAHFSSSSPRSFCIQRVKCTAESLRSNKSLLSARSDSDQRIALESPTGVDGAVDGQHNLNQAATAQLDTPAAELAKDLTENPPPPLDELAAEFVKDLTDNNLLGQLYSPATETAKYPTEENLPPRLDARATEAAKDLVGGHLPAELGSPAAESATHLAEAKLPSELDGPAPESAKDLIEEHLSSLGELSDKDAFGKHLFDTQGDLAADRSVQPESFTHAMPQFDAPSPSVGGGFDPDEQETTTESSSSSLNKKVATPTGCIRIWNLPDNITASMLLAAISMHGPFSKVFSARMRHLAGSTYALIDFLNKPAGESLFKFIRDRKLIIGGQAAKCRWHDSDYKINYAPQRSRVLVVAINQDLANYNFLGRLRALSDGEAKNADIVVEPILTVGGWVALVCSYLDALPANYARESLKRDGLRATFGADPVEVGIISAYEANLRLAERLVAASFRRHGMMEDQVVSKSIAELAQERLEKHVKLAPPPRSTMKDASLDHFVAMSQAACQPTAKRTPLNDSFPSPDYLEEWEHSEGTGYGLDGPRFATSAPAASWPGELPTADEQPGAKQQSWPDSNRRPRSHPKSHDVTTDVLEDIDKALERFRKEF